MTALGSYSQYETLVFLQSVARHGADKAAITDIANVLAKNQLIGSNNHYDPARFKPEALRVLYNQLVVRTYREAEKPQTNSQTHTATVTELGNGSDNPRKRKLSTTPPRDESPSEQQFVQRLVDRLYRKFREDTIAELRQDEAIYTQLQKDIDKLEGKQIKLPRRPTPPIPRETAVKPTARFPSPCRSDQVDPVSIQLQADFDAARHDVKMPSAPPAHARPYHAPAIPVHALVDRTQGSPIPSAINTFPRPTSETPQGKPGQPAPPPPPPSAQRHSPGAFNRTLPPPSPQHNSYGGSTAGPHGYSQPAQGPPSLLSSLHSLQRVPSQDHSSMQRSQSQGRRSPMPPQPLSYSPYPQFSQPSPPAPPPSGWHSPVPQPYYPHSGYSSPHQYPALNGKYPPNHNSIPHQPPFHPYSHTAPAPYHGQQTWRGPPVPPYQPHALSAATTPMPRPSSRVSIARSGSVTPWKRKSLPHHIRLRSPASTERDVSPLSDSEVSSESKEVSDVDKPASPVSKDPIKDGTPASSTSRSQSEASEEPAPRRPVGRPAKNRANLPATPGSMVADVGIQQQSSEQRRSRLRANVHLQPGTPASSDVGKRKRENLSTSPAPPATLTQSSTTIRDIAASADLSLVLVSKSFAKTAQLLLNEVTTHKLAGIFAKPLSERDAPGYKGLVHRPQDLKTIKAAVSKGCRLATVAIEELEAKASQYSQGEVNHSLESSSQEGPIGNGFYLVKSNEDFVPPRGIVNSAQLEMELVRMFANAIMFNPLPTSERGFGRPLRLRKHGGATLPRSRASPDDDTDQERDTSADSTSSESTSDERGIISDAREMFHDVSSLISKWREVEEEKTNAVPAALAGTGVGSNLSTPLTSKQKDRDRERHASTTASSNGGEDDREGTPSLATGRKRRKVEH